ncbi:MAG: hypothetical protein R2836_00885 [Chitinophagales bacterium]
MPFAKAESQLQTLTAPQAAGNKVVLVITTESQPFTLLNVVVFVPTKLASQVVLLIVIGEAC